MGVVVPARVGGVDLSFKNVADGETADVPARVGGVDLSMRVLWKIGWSSVPARVGGVDLSWTIPMHIPQKLRPRPCGRGGFKPM